MVNNSTQNNTKDLSVIVACYNVYPYVKECLESLAQVQFPKDRIEVLLVNDGSTDHKTPQILQTYAHQYSFMHYLPKSNGGLSDARNYGMKHAHGTYIAFVDGDDKVPQMAYAKLMHMAWYSHPNIVSGYVRRTGIHYHRGCYLYKQAIQDKNPNTNIYKMPSLLFDTTAWNKVYSAKFLRQHNLWFKKGILYEDLPFELKAHLLSKHDATITNNVYYWRKRSGSITTQKGTLNNLKARLYSLHLCLKALHEQQVPLSSLLYHLFIRKILFTDLNLFLKNIGDNTFNYLCQAQKLVYRFLTGIQIQSLPQLSSRELNTKPLDAQDLYQQEWRINPQQKSGKITNVLDSTVVKTEPLKQQILYHAIKTCNLKLLTKYTYIPKRKIGYFKHGKYCLHDTSNSNFLNLKYNTLPTCQKLMNIKQDQKQPIIYGYGMFRIADLPLHSKKLRALVGKNHHTVNHYENLSAKLVNLNNHKSTPVSINRKATPMYKHIFKPKTAWTNGRYQFSFNYLTAYHDLGLGTWRLLVTDTYAHRYSVTRFLGQPQSKEKTLLHLKLSSQNVLKIHYTPRWDLEFQAGKLSISRERILSNPQVKSHTLLVKDNYPNDKWLKPVITFSDGQILLGHKKYHQNDTVLSFALNKWPIMPSPHHVSINLYDLRTDFHLSYGYQQETARQVWSIGHNTILAIHQNKYHHLRLAKEKVPFKVTSVNTFSKYLVLKVFCQCNFTQRDLKLNHKYGKAIFLSTNKKYRKVLPADKILYLKHNALQEVVIPLVINQHQLSFLQGTYTATFYLYCHGIFSEFGLLGTPNVVYFDKKITSLTSTLATCQTKSGEHGRFTFKIKQPWTGINKTKGLRAINQSVVYPLLHLLPLKKNTVVFDCYWGQQFSSNERAIYQYMQKYYPQYKYVWLFKNNQHKVTGVAQRIREGSLKYWLTMARAKYFFQNTNLPNHYFKRPGQVEVETLHGTFLKQMGFDEPSFKYGNYKTQQNFARRNRRWDYMIAPSNYMKRVSGHAFHYHQNWLLTGFPRNDELIQHNNQNYINQIKQKLNIPNNKKVILYAPTYRHNDHNFYLDLKHLKEVLGNRYVVLIRLHYFVAHTHSFFNYPNFVYDVSDYPDINDLFLISNVLVTDYSSVMFDFAYLKRPIIFYAYDIDTYLNHVKRGLYLNYRQQMPGPIVRNQSELEDQLLHLPQVNKRYHSTLLNFNHRFVQYGKQGNATKQVINQVFKHPSPLNQKPDQHVIFNKFWHFFKINDIKSAWFNYLEKKLPKQNIIIFKSASNSGYSGNPKALYQYIVKHFHQYQCYWSISKDKVTSFRKRHLPYVINSTYSGLRKQAQARYWIIDGTLPLSWHFDSQVHILQTGQQTPLYKVGVDAPYSDHSVPQVSNHRQKLYKDSQRWSMYLVPNQYALNILPKAYRMKAGQLILSGYPQDDELVKEQGNKTLLTKIKQKYNLPYDKKLVLCLLNQKDLQALSISRLKEQLGRKVFIIVQTPHQDFEKIKQLFLISNILITDNPNLMITYTILKRPIIYFAKHAINRNNYYKITFPVNRISDTKKVSKKLKHALSDNWSPNHKYLSCRRIFNQYEDGQNSARVAKEFLDNKNNVTREFPLKVHKILVPLNTICWEKLPWQSNGYSSNYLRNANLPSIVLDREQLYAKGKPVPLSQCFVKVQLSISNQIVYVAEQDLEN